ncbi:MAG TPA: adenylate/guanylate cyclase domain-containing protein [Nitrososphaeraceae archaeon]|jgi:class 3 adenylate cyclase
MTLKRDDKLNFKITKVENRLLAIVFWDISGFSKLAKDLEGNNELLLGFLQEYFEISINIINKNGGTLDKFIGDGVMAIFGLNDTEQDTSIASIDSVTAAIELLKEFANLKTKWGKEISKIVVDFNIADLGLKCGINTGKALSCTLKIEGRNQITALGTTVNLANRLCDDKGMAGRIFVSTSTYYNIRERFQLMSRGKQEISNMGFHEIFEVINTFEKGQTLPRLTKGIGKVTATIPDEISLDASSRVSAEFLGSVDLGFMTLKIEDSTGKEPLWFPDPGSVKVEYNAETGEISDTGTLTFRNDKYFQEWDFNIQSELKQLKPGTGVATLGMFETKDFVGNDGNTIPYRPHVDLVIKKITLI